MYLGTSGYVGDLVSYLWHQGSKSTCELGIILRFSSGSSTHNLQVYVRTRIFSPMHEQLLLMLPLMVDLPLVGSLGTR